MKMRRKIILLVYAMLLLIISVSSVAQADQSLQGFMPDTKTLTNATLQSTYDKYPIWNYTFDGESINGFLHPIDSAVQDVFLNIINALFFLHVLLTTVVTYMLVSCYKLNIFSLIPDALNNVVMAVKTATFDGFIEVIIICAGIYGIYKTLKGQQSAGFRVWLSLFIIIGLSVWFFQNPALFGKNLNEGTQAICTKILYDTSGPAGMAVNQPITSGDDAVVLMGNHYWNLAVMKPYELIQYGDIQNNDPENEFLKYAPNDDKRQENADNLAKTNTTFTLSGIGGRFGLTLFMLVIGLIYNVCMLLISAIILYNQAAALFWICFAGIFFLFSLYPSHGGQILVKWFLETFGFMLKRITITLALSIYFSVTISLYNLVGTYGYLMVIGLNIIMLIIAIKNFDKVYKMLLGLISFDAAMVQKGMKSGGSLMSKAGHLAVAGYASYKAVQGVKGTMEKRVRNNFDKNNKRKAVDVLAQRYDNDKKSALFAAEAELFHEFQQDKEQAELDAKVNGMPVQYNNFVKQAQQRKKQGLSMFTDEQIKERVKETEFVKSVDDRKQKGYTPFSEGQIKSTLNKMYELKKEGNDPGRLTYTNVEGKTDEQIQADQREKDRRINMVKGNLANRSIQNNDAIERNIESGAYKIPGSGGRTTRSQERENENVVDIANYNRTKENKRDIDLKEGINERQQINNAREKTERVNNVETANVNTENRKERAERVNNVETANVNTENRKERAERVNNVETANVNTENRKERTEKVNNVETANVNTENRRERTETVVNTENTKVNRESRQERTERIIDVENTNVETVNTTNKNESKISAREVLAATQAIKNRSKVKDLYEQLKGTGTDSKDKSK